MGSTRPRARCKLNTNQIKSIRLVTLLHAVRARAVVPADAGDRSALTPEGRAGARPRRSIDRSIDRSNRFDRYARFNRNQPTNQPTNQPLEQTIDQFHRFDRYTWFNRHQPPEQTIDRFDRCPTVRTITRMVQKLKHPVMGQSNPESMHRSNRYEGFNRSIDRSIDTDRPTDREGRAPIGVGNPSRGTRAHERVADDDRRGLEV